MTHATSILGTVLLFTQAPLAFHVQDIPGLRVESAPGIIESYTLNARQADLDGDGALDLIFSREVSFQRNGLFPREARVPLPEFSTRPLLDTWGGEIYLRLDDRVRIIRWDGSAWHTRVEQVVSWPADDRDVFQQQPAQGMAAHAAMITRFLHDLDGDGSPELIAASPDGLHVFSTVDGHVEEAGVLDILPPLACAIPSRARLWPIARRLLEFPIQKMECRLIIEGINVGVLSREETRGNRVRFRLDTLRVLKDASGRFRIDGSAPSDKDQQFTEWMPAYLEPCRLNKDAQLDLAGSMWEVTAASLIPAPILTLTVSLDGGKSLRHVRTTSFQTAPALLDFDGDGDLDLVIGSTGFFDSGAREVAARYFTRSAIEHTLHVYPQTGGAFEPKPRLSHALTLTTSSPPVLEDATYQRYRRGMLISLAGDFDGDGYRDLLVQDYPDRLAVFLAAGYSFADRPSVTVPAEPNCQFAAADVNGDGRSDIVMRWIPAQAARNAERCRVFLSRETQQ